MSFAAVPAIFCIDAAEGPGPDTYRITYDLQDTSKMFLYNYFTNIPTDPIYWMMIGRNPAFVSERRVRRIPDTQRIIFSFSLFEKVYDCYDRRPSKGGIILPHWLVSILKSIRFPNSIAEPVGGRPQLFPSLPLRHRGQSSPLTLNVVAGPLYTMRFDKVGMPHNPQKCLFIDNIHYV